MYGKGAEAEPPGATLASCVDVEIAKAIVTIEPGPHSALRYVRH
jgi:hypothetical protein